MYAKLSSGAALAAVAAVGLMGASANAQQLPNQVITTAYTVGASGYAQAVAIGAAMREKTGANLRVLPGKNDLSRMAPVTQNRAHFSFNGLGTVMAQEAAFEFSTRDWGPQNLRIITYNIGGNCLMPAFVGDRNIKTVYDLKGLRITQIAAAPALNYNLYTYLRAADLTWDDVEIVSVGGQPAAVDAIISGRADGMFTSTIAAHPRQFEASPRGLAWPEIPHDDDAAWERFFKAGPYYVKHHCTRGVGIDPNKPIQAATYPYPILMTYDRDNDDFAYALTKFMVEEFETYKDTAPGNDGWHPENFNPIWAVPVHNGAIRFYRERGTWSAEHQANTDALLERQRKLKALWADVMEKHRRSTDAEFYDAWQKARADMLASANLAVIWDNWPHPQ